MASLMKRVKAVMDRTVEPERSEVHTDADEPMEEPPASAPPPPLEKKAAKRAKTAAPSTKDGDASKTKTKKAAAAADADGKKKKLKATAKIAKAKPVSKALQTRAVYEDGLPEYMKKFRDSNIKAVAERAGVYRIYERAKVHARVKHIIANIVDEMFITPGLIAMKANGRKTYGMDTLQHVLSGSEIKILGIDNSVRKRGPKKADVKAAADATVKAPS